MAFRDWVRAIRRSKNLTQEDFAAAVGVSQTTVSQWESGRNGPTLANLAALAKLDDKKLSDVAHYVDETASADAVESGTPSDAVVNQPGGLERYQALIHELEFISDDGIALVHDQVRYVLRERYPRAPRGAQPTEGGGESDAEETGSQGDTGQAGSGDRG